MNPARQQESRERLYVETATQPSPWGRAGPQSPNARRLSFFENTKLSPRIYSNIEREFPCPSSNTSGEVPSPISGLEMPEVQHQKARATALGFCRRPRVRRRPAGACGSCGDTAGHARCARHELTLMPERGRTPDEACRVCAGRYRYCLRQTGLRLRCGLGFTGTGISASQINRQLAGVVIP